MEFCARVDGRPDIRDLIYDSQVPVYAYVAIMPFRQVHFGSFLPQALWRGGTWCSKIQDLSGEAIDEKSFPPGGRVRTAAENQGKDPEGYAAMVRKEITIEGLDDDKQLLALTTAEAEEIGFVDGVFATRAELLSALDLAGSGGLWS